MILALVWNIAAKLKNTCFLFSQAIYNLKQFYKLNVCEQNETFIFFSLPDPSRIHKLSLGILIFMAI